MSETYDQRVTTTYTEGLPREGLPAWGTQGGRVWRRSVFQLCSPGGSFYIARIQSPHGIANTR